MLMEQVYNEDAIERIAELVRFNLQANVLALQDARLAAIHRPALHAQQGAPLAVVHNAQGSFALALAFVFRPVSHIASLSLTRELIRCAPSDVHGSLQSCLSEAMLLSQLQAHVKGQQTFTV